MDTIKDLIIRARGSRNMNQFAEACGISRASLYRIAAGNINQPVPKNTLQSILSNADPDASLTIEELEAAIDETLKLRSGSATQKQKTLSKMHKLEIIMRRAVEDYLLDTGLFVRKVDIESLNRNDFELAVAAGATEEHYSFNLRYNVDINERVKQHIYTALNLATSGAWTYIIYCYDEADYDPDAVFQIVEKLEKIIKAQIPEIEGSIIVAYLKESGTVKFREILPSNKKKLVSFDGTV